MRRSPRKVLRSMQAAPGKAWNSYIGFLARVAGAAHKRQTVVIAVTVMVTSLSIVFQSRLDAAGLVWWSESGRNMLFVFAIAFALTGAGPFRDIQGGGGAMRAEPSRSTA